MPIKGVGDRPQRIGNIKIGKKGAVKKGAHGDYRIPEKAMDFTVTTMERDGNDDWVRDDTAMDWLKQEFNQDKPIQIPIMLLADDIDSNFRYNMEAWKASDLICSGDQETAIVKATGESRECPCDWKNADGKGVKKCKPHGALNVVLPFAGRVGGIHRFSTTSWLSIGNIVATLRQIQQMTGGVLMGIPLMMTVTPTKVYPKGNDQASIVPIVGIHYEGDTMQLLEAVKIQTQARITSGLNIQRLNQIASGALIDTDEDVRDWATEFASPAEQEANAAEPLQSADVPSDVQQSSDTSTVTEIDNNELAHPIPDEFDRNSIIWRGPYIGKKWCDPAVPDGGLAHIFEQLDDCIAADKKYCEFAGEEIAARMDSDKADRTASENEAAAEEEQSQAPTEPQQESAF